MYSYVCILCKCGRFSWFVIYSLCLSIITIGSQVFFQSLVFLATLRRKFTAILLLQGLFVLVDKFWNRKELVDYSSATLKKRSPCVADDEVCPKNESGTRRLETFFWRRRRVPGVASGEVLNEDWLEDVATVAVDEDNVFPSLPLTIEAISSPKNCSSSFAEGRSWMVADQDRSMISRSPDA